MSMSNTTEVFAAYFSCFQMQPCCLSLVWWWASNCNWSRPDF